MKLDKIENIVKNILENEKETRSDDMLLFYMYCTKYGCASDSMFFKIFKDSEYRNNMGLSVFESISRARRKIQADNEELRPPKKVQDARLDKEAEFINYAIGGYNPTFKGFIDNIN